MSEILFADDDPPTREMVAAYLQAGGHSVRTAPDGTEALAEMGRSAPDLVLLDYQMGEPDGFAVCRAIKADPRWEHIPVLILTGMGDLEDRLSGFDAGADEYLAKPIDGRELLARVQALLQLTRRGLERNPSSELPGAGAIDREFVRRLAGADTFCVCYLDFDHFKPFGERFGFSLTDRLIRELGDALRDVADGSDTFAGHVGGDDFIAFSPPEEAEALVTAAQQSVSSSLERVLPEEVLRSGSYRGEDRAGSVRDFPLTRLSAAIIRVEPGGELSLAKLGEQVAAAKRQAKRSAAGVAHVEITL